MKTALSFLLTAIAAMTVGCGQAASSNSQDDTSVRQATENASQNEPTGQMEHKNGTVQISFPFVRQDRIASNQFAVWIEDMDGTFVKTLFATQFVASGGYEQRPEAIPDWVERSGLNNGTASGIDAVTGATPDTGTLQFSWDCTDSEGNPLPEGEYRFLVEAAVSWDSRVVYEGTIGIGGAEHLAAASAEGSGEAAEGQNMIGDVTAAYTPR